MFFGENTRRFGMFLSVVRICPASCAAASLASCKRTFCDFWWPNNNYNAQLLVDNFCSIRVRYLQWFKNQFCLPEHCVVVPETNNHKSGFDPRISPCQRGLWNQVAWFVYVTAHDPTVHEFGTATIFFLPPSSLIHTVHAIEWNIRPLASSGTLATTLCRLRDLKTWRLSSKTPKAGWKRLPEMYKTTIVGLVIQVAWIPLFVFHLGKGNVDQPDQECRLRQSSPSVQGQRVARRGSCWQHASEHDGQICHIMSYLFFPFFPANGKIESIQTPDKYNAQVPVSLVGQKPFKCGTSTTIDWQTQQFSFVQLKSFLL